MLRDYLLFEAFAYHMVNMAQQKRIDKEFDLNGTFYAFDSTAIEPDSGAQSLVSKSIPSWIAASSSKILLGKL